MPRCTSAASFDRHPAAELAVDKTGCVVSSPLALACRGQQQGGHGATFGRLGWDRDGARGSDVKLGILVATRDIDCHWPHGKGTPLHELVIFGGEPSLESMV